MPSFPDDCLPPEGNYQLRVALLQAINAWAATRGYVFVTGRSIKTFDINVPPRLITVLGRVLLLLSCNSAVESLYPLLLSGFGSWQVCILYTCQGKKMSGFIIKKRG